MMMTHPAAEEEGSRPPPSFKTAEAGAGSQPRRLFTPRDPEDWERVKPILKELYLNRGLTLKALLQEMRDVHHIKATIRQYNHRFAKWGWRKYKKKRLGSVAAQSSTQDESYQADVSSIGSPENSVVASPPTKLFVHESDFAARLSFGLNSYRDYILSWAATDPRWSKPTRYQSIEVDRKRLPIEDQLLVARHYVHLEDYVHAGHQLRVAFLNIEPLVNDGHISGAWDLFIVAPLIICKMDRDADVIMKLYTNYLYQQLLVQRGKQHPMTTMARSLRAAADEGTPNVFHFISRLCQLLYDTFRELRGLCASTLYSRWIFARLTDDSEAKAQMSADWRQLAWHAEAEYGGVHALALNFQSLALQGTTRGLTRYDEATVAGFERIAAVSKQQWQQAKGRSADPWQGSLEISVYRFAQYALAKYWAERQGQGQVQGQDGEVVSGSDSDGAAARTSLVQYCQDMVFLEPDVTPDAQWGKYGTLAEEMLRGAGLEKEAQAVARWRQQREIDPAVRATFEREEAERAGDTSEWWSSSADDKVMEEELDSD